ncbi:MAG: short-chain dehydrogenase/reductase [Spirochaetae bacterium HGW-Spirochaetae-7]|nr:MAG: short-chain dehydrogenase/reductase [Spirochaetae bacterium HGW-Spirochaetae-7]
MADRKRTGVLVTGSSSGLGNAIATQLAKGNRIDALVCCAGMGIAGAVEETPIAEASRQMDVNFMGVVRIVKAVLPGMRENGGTILVVGSMAGLTGIPFQSFYSASKYALEGFVESLRMELCGFPVRVALIEPGDFKTGFTSARRILGLGEGSPYAVAGRRAIGVMEDSERAGYDPVLVARLALKLISRKRLRSRYTVGPGFQKFAMVLKRFIPHRLYEALFMIYYKLNAGNGE